MSKISPSKNNTDHWIKTVMKIKILIPKTVNIWRWSTGHDIYIIILILFLTQKEENLNKWKMQSNYLLDTATANFSMWA